MKWQGLEREAVRTLKEMNPGAWQVWVDAHKGTIEAALRRAMAEGARRAGTMIDRKLNYRETGSELQQGRIDAKLAATSVCLTLATRIEEDRE